MAVALRTVARPDALRENRRTMARDIQPIETMAVMAMTMSCQTCMSNIALPPGWRDMDNSNNGRILALPKRDCSRLSWPNILIRPSNRLLSGQSPKGVTAFE